MVKEMDFGGRMDRRSSGFALRYSTVGSLLLSCGLLVSASSCGRDSAGPGGVQHSEPANFPYSPIEEAPASDPDHPYGVLPAPSDLRGEKNFANLINKYQSARPTRVPWVGYWWPYTANGIASGRYAGGYSPAGKYDAARGGVTQAQYWEATHHGARVRGVQGWWGHCNGWCAAAALYPEPLERQKVNGITFDVGDQKALLSEAAMEATADFYGNRVDWSSDWTTPKYDDVIPAQYFLVLTNYLGKLGQTVNIDRYTGDQVWNQPLAGYRFEYPKPEDYLGADARAPGVYRILLTSTIWWGRDEVEPNSVTVPFQFESNQHFEQRTLQMELWLDGPVVFNASGQVISSGDVVVKREGNWLMGGVWRNGAGLLVDAHPDYMWVPFTVLKPDPRAEDPYANIHIDIEWLKRYLVVGLDDPSAQPRPVEPAPVPSPSGSASPVPRPSGRPSPRPSGAPSVSPIPAPLPSSGPSLSPIPPSPIPPSPLPPPVSPPEVRPSPMPSRGRA